MCWSSGSGVHALVALGFDFWACRSFPHSRLLDLRSNLNCQNQIKSNRLQDLRVIFTQVGFPKSESGSLGSGSWSKYIIIIEVYMISYIKLTVFIAAVTIIVLVFNNFDVGFAIVWILRTLVY